MRREASWTLVVGATAALALTGCSPEADAPQGSPSSTTGPSPVEVRDGRVCPFFTSAERDTLLLSTDLGPVPSSETPSSRAEKEAAERKRKREEARDKGVVDTCGYVGPLSGGGPLKQVRVRLREGSVAEWGRTLPGYEPREDARQGEVAFQAETAFGNTGVCRLLAPGPTASGDDATTTVELEVYIPISSPSQRRPGDVCAAMDQAVPLIEKKFPHH